jgi:hypothetical protein
LELVPKASDIEERTSWGRQKSGFHMPICGMLGKDNQSSARLSRTPAAMGCGGGDVELIRQRIVEPHASQQVRHHLCLNFLGLHFARFEIRVIVAFDSFQTFASDDLMLSSYKVPLGCLGSQKPG